MADLINDWPHANFTFTAPPGRDDVTDARVFRNRAFVVLPWQLAPAERDEVAATGRVFLSILGQGMPPVRVGSESDIRAMVADFGCWPAAPPPARRDRSIEQVGQAILDAMTGSRIETSMLGAADALACSVAFAMKASGAKRPEDTDAMVDELAQAIRAHVRANWSHDLTKL